VCFAPQINLVTLLHNNVLIVIQHVLLALQQHPATVSLAIFPNIISTLVHTHVWPVQPRNSVHQVHAMIVIHLVQFVMVQQTPAVSLAHYLASLLKILA